VLNGFGDLKEIEKIRNSILNEFGTAAIYVPADMAQRGISEEEVVREVLLAPSP
jgi:hypothetical protein